MKLILLLSIIITILCIDSLSIKPVGQFPVYSVAFLQLGRFNSTQPIALLASAFGVFSGDGLYYVPKINMKDINNTKPITITQNLNWPNEPEFAPSGTVQGYPSVAFIGGGFLVPTKDTGSINAIDMSTTNFVPSQISESKSGWFYHRVRFNDMDKDGIIDVLTSRGTKPIFGSGQGELIWYKQPSSSPLSGNPWTANHIADGPDFLFELVDVNNDGIKEVAAAEFFGQKLTLTYSTTGTWTDPASIKQIVIDEKINAAFDVRVLDVNGDGKVDLVATNHQGDGTGAIFAYEVPSNWQAGNWPRHVLASGFPVNEGGPNQAAPGAPIPFYPQTADNKGRAWIALSGDGSQCAYELRPVTPNGWDYTLSTIINAGGTVGQIAVADVDNDGYSEVFVPAYDSGIVYVFSYSP